MIYFVRNYEGGPIKIGTTIQFEMRLRQLKAEHGGVFEVLGVMPGGICEERAIHDRFSHRRLETQREWFVPGEELDQFVAEFCHPWEGDGREDTPIKIDRPLAAKVKAIATHRGTGSAEVLSELARVAIDREYARVLRELEAR